MPPLKLCSRKLSNVRGHFKDNLLYSPLMCRLDWRTLWKRRRDSAQNLDLRAGARTFFYPEPQNLSNAREMER